MPDSRFWARKIPLKYSKECQTGTCRWSMLHWVKGRTEEKDFLEKERKGLTVSDLEGEKILPLASSRFCKWKGLLAPHDFLRTSALPAIESPPDDCFWRGKFLLRASHTRVLLLCRFSCWFGQRCPQVRQAGLFARSHCSEYGHLPEG